MTPGDPLIRLAAVSKIYEASEPLRIADFAMTRADRFVISGLDAGAAAMFVYLVTGAALPDEGEVRVAGRSTRDIATDTEWLSSLDRFGIVTPRAVLLDGLSVAANLALPITLSIDPMADEVRDRVRREAGDVGLATDRLDGPVGALSAAERLRLHLSRAVTLGPEVLLLEHPTTGLDGGAQSAAFGDTLRAVSARRGCGWVAFSDDEAFAGASGGTRLRFDPATGRMRRRRWWWS